MAEGKLLSDINFVLKIPALILLVLAAVVLAATFGGLEMTWWSLVYVWIVAVMMIMYGTDGMPFLQESIYLLGGFLFCMVGGCMAACAYSVSGYKSDEAEWEGSAQASRVGGALIIIASIVMLADGILLIVKRVRGEPVVTIPDAKGGDGPSADSEG